MTAYGYENPLSSVEDQGLVDGFLMKPLTMTSLFDSVLSRDFCFCKVTSNYSTLNFVECLEVSSQKLKSHDQDY